MNTLRRGFSEQLGAETSVETPIGDPANRFFNVNAFGVPVERHTTGAWLAQAGVHPKAVQVVMRHSTIMLTMDV